jgi:hypothetical protein
VIGFAAHLRVYEPLGAYDEEQRHSWTSYVDDGPPSRPVLMALEHERALAAACAVPPRLDVAADTEHAYVRHLDGLTYVCPWRLQLRAWQALEDFRTLLPDELTEAFLPPATLLGAEVEHESWVAANPDVTPGIRSATWSVPLTWFALFEPEERRLVLGERRASGAADGGALAQTGLDRALVYLTAMSRARRRAARALHVVRRVFDDGPAIEGLDELGRWLEEFHPHSLVELDYGGLVHILDDAALRADESVAEVAAAITGMETGQAELAVAMHKRVVSRWRVVRALESAN